MNILTRVMRDTALPENVDMRQCSIQLTSTQPKLADCRTSNGTPVIVDLTSHAKLHAGVLELVELQQEETST